MKAGVPILVALQTLFSLYMLYDAVSRGRQQYWWLVVMFPFGELVYFFAVYWPENKHRFGSLATLLSRPPTVDELRRDFEMTPSLENKKRLALGLHDAGLFAEGAGLFAEVLQRTPEDRECLYGYAQCLLGTADDTDDEEALRALEHLVDLDRRYQDGRPAFLLAGLLANAGRREHGLDVLRAQAKSTHRMRAHVELAQCLIESATVPGGHPEDGGPETADTNADALIREARATLRRGIDSFETSPRVIRKADAKFARQARQILGSLGGLND